jgi:hypothetical protein
LPALRILQQVDHGALAKSTGSRELIKYQKSIKMSCGHVVEAPGKAHADEFPLCLTKQYCRIYGSKFETSP